MRKIVGSVLVVAATVALAACRGAGTPITSSSAGAVAAGPAGDGAASASAAVTTFLQAARATDVQTMARTFGTASGPVAARERANEVEKRMRSLACYLAHDSARVVDELPGVGAGRTLSVELRQSELVRRTRFTTVPGPRNRWFVESFDINALADFCRPNGSRAGR